MVRSHTFPSEVLVRWEFSSGCLGEPGSWEKDKVAPIGLQGFPYPKDIETGSSLAICEWIPRGWHQSGSILHPKGFEDKEIVALCGAHSVGSCHLERSGYDGAWTDNKLKFDNSYFKDGDSQ